MEVNRKRNTGQIAKLMEAHFASVKNAAVHCIVLVLVSALPLAALITGVTKIDQCAIQPMIPVWLIVVGFSGVLGCAVLITMFICRVWCCYESFSKNQKKIFMFCVGCILCLIVTFHFAWMIAGCVWIFRAKANVEFDNETSSNYCRNSVYNFANGLVILQISIFSLLACLIYCGLMVIVYHKLRDS